MLTKLNAQIHKVLLGGMLVGIVSTSGISTVMASASTPLPQDQQPLGLSAAPDLVVTDIWTNSPSLVAGQAYDLNFTIRNRGNADIAKTFYTKLDITSPYIGKQYEEIYRFSNGLPAGESETVSVDLTTSPVGPYEFKIATDSTNVVAESNENNNVLSEQWSFTFNKKSPANGAIIPLPASSDHVLQWNDAGVERYQYCIGSYIDSCDAIPDNDLNTRNALYSGEGEFTLLPGHTYYWQVIARPDVPGPDPEIPADNGVWFSFTVQPPILSVSTTGSGSGRVTSDPEGIDCGETCSASFDDSTPVTLFATPDDGSTFTGWSGDCSGDGDCTVSMDADRSVTADFALNPVLTVTKTGTGSGRVTSNPEGIDCGETCSASFDYSTPVTLFATPDDGSTFTGWSGDCSGDGDCTVTMDADRSVTANCDDTTPPTVVSSVPSTTAVSGSINFIVTFSESVTGVDVRDFALTTTGGLTGVTVTSVTGSGASYAVSVNVGSGVTGASGTIRLDVLDNDSIVDAASNPLGGPFTSGGVFTIFVGSVSITSNKNVVAVGRPHVGDEVASYSGFSSGSLTSYLPMLFKAYSGSYNSAFYIQNVSASTANVTIKYYDTVGALSCTINDTVAPLASKGYWLPSPSCLPAGWVGSVVVTSTQPIVTVGRPHVGDQVMAYDGFSSGSTTSYLPMLFKGAYGGSYDSAFYVQNVNASTIANITIKYYGSTGVLNCTVNDTVAPFASKGYWLPGQACLPAGWIGSVVVTSDKPIVTVGRPHIGSQVTTYNGFSAGASSSYVPMLFKGAFGGGSYNSAFYVQNTVASTAAVTIKFYDSVGNLSCAVNDTVAALASKGYWLPSQTCLPATDWIGSVVVTSNQPIVAIGRAHVGDQVTAYNGFSSGSSSSYLPMLFRNGFDGSYNSAFYIQNTATSTATVTIKLYASTGALTCTSNDSIPALATLGVWLPGLTCAP